MRQRRGGVPGPPRGDPGQVPPGGDPGQVPPPGGTQVRYPPRGGPRSGTPGGGGGVTGSGTPLGYPGQVPPRGGVTGSGTPRGGGVPGSGTPWGGGTRVGQQKEYSLHGGRYASCVHAGGLSCYRPYPKGGEGTVFTVVCWSTGERGYPCSLVPGSYLGGGGSPAHRSLVVSQGEGGTPGFWSQVLSGEGGYPCHVIGQGYPLFPQPGPGQEYAIPSSSPARTSTEYPLPLDRTCHRQDTAREAHLLRFHAGELSCLNIDKTSPSFDVMCLDVQVVL